MSTLTSSSTDAQVFAAYDDAASYAEDDDPAKAKLFVTAVRILLRRLPTFSAHGTARTQLSTELLQKQLERAEEWLASNDTETVSAGGAGVATHFSLEGFRT